MESMNRKAQSAMEFLMTYGWAILVLVVAIAALAYFGVLSPSKLMPESCISSAGMDCMGKATIKALSLEFALKNNQGSAIDISSLSLPADTVYGTCTYTANGVDLATPVRVLNNDMVRLKVSCTTGPDAGNNYAEAIVVRYNNIESGLSNQVSVEIKGKVIP